MLKKWILIQRVNILLRKDLWEFYDANSEDIEVVSILPAMALGPLIAKSNISALRLLIDMLKSGLPGYPDNDDVTLVVVGVGDLGILHVKALESKKTKGKRLSAYSGSITIKNILSLYERNFAKLGFSIHKKPVSVDEVKKAAETSMGPKFTLKALGNGATVDCSETKDLVHGGMKFSSPEGAVVEAINSVLKFGIIEAPNSK